MSNANEKCSQAAYYWSVADAFATRHATQSASRQTRLARMAEEDHIKGECRCEELGTPWSRNQ